MVDESNETEKYNMRQICFDNYMPNNYYWWRVLKTCCFILICDSIVTFNEWTINLLRLSLRNGGCAIKRIWR